MPAFAASLCSELLLYVFSAKHIHGCPDHAFGLQRMFSCHVRITPISQWIYPAQALEYVTCKHTASSLPGAAQEDQDSTIPSCCCTWSRALSQADAQHPEMQMPGQRQGRGSQRGWSWGWAAAPGSHCSQGMMLILSPSSFCGRQRFWHLLTLLSSTLHVWERKPCSGTAFGWLETPLGCSTCQGLLSDPGTEMTDLRTLFTGSPIYCG